MKEKCWNVSEQGWKYKWAAKIAENLDKNTTLEFLIGLSCHMLLMEWQVSLQARWDQIEVFLMIYSRSGDWCWDIG